MLDGDFSIIWAVWLGFFAVVEGVAVFNKKKGDTLSEHVWQLFSVKHEGKAVWARRGTLYAFLLWLVTHFVTGGAV